MGGLIHEYRPSLDDLGIGTLQVAAGVHSRTLGTTAGPRQTPTSRSADKVPRRPGRAHMAA
jgi:hypothetical protein